MLFLQCSLQSLFITIPFVKYFTPTAQHSFTPIISHCPLLNTGEGQTNQEKRAHRIKGFCFPFILIYCLSLCYITVWSHGATTTSSISINRVRKERKMGPVREKTEICEKCCAAKKLIINSENIRGQNSMIQRERMSGAGNEKRKSKNTARYSVALWLPVTYVLVRRDEVIYGVTLQ